MSKIKYLISEDGIPYKAKKKKFNAKDRYRLKREALIAYQKEWNKKYRKPYDPDYYVKNRERIITAVLAQAKKSPEKFAARTRKRQAAQKDRTPKFLTNGHWLEILNFYKQAADLSDSTGVPYVVDHIVPLQGKNVSGLHVPWNLQVVTRTQNSKKGNRY